MKLFKAALFCIIIAACFGCESETQIADRVMKKRQDFESVVGTKIVSLSDEDDYRTTTIILSDGRKITVSSGKHRHETKIVPQNYKE